MDNRNLLVGLSVLCVILVALIFSGATSTTVYINRTVYPVEGLQVFYLYPLRCVNCDLNKPGQCDFCTSYYDVRLMDLVSQEVGAPVKFVVSDVVQRPNVLVVNDDKMTLGDAKTRYNIANTLCRFAGVEKSCALFNGELARIESCVEGLGVEPGTVVYHTSSGNCPVCRKMDSIVSELKGLEYQDGTYYNVKSADHQNKDDIKIVTDCMNSFDNIDYAPQLLCPINGMDLTGEFTLGQAREFADKCIQSA
ncbi:MAG: hypothetical protein KKD39_04530 [Candidatus Altiarchaeota archaeon]|nr:hypothetical protein [Candidatus Altiarchaeota archaeon]